jgi:hypothetical protein
MRFKIVACIPLILSVFIFVLAAPVPVRAPRGIYDRSGSDSDTEWWTPPRAKSSSPDHAGSSGSHPGVGMPSPSTVGGDSPLWSKAWSTPGGTGVLWDPEGVVKPGTTAEIPPASSTGGKAKSVSWAPLKDVQLPTGLTVKTPLATDLKLIPSYPPGWEEFLAKQAAQQSPEPKKPQSKGFVSKSKKFFSKLGKLKFRPMS